jgi:GT2 family glycosyltransferase
MISIIICSIDAAKFAAVSRMYADVLGKEPYEIIKIPDARSLAEGYNRGLAKSKGDIVIFSHDDIHILTRDLAARLKRHMDNYDCIGVAGTTRMVGPTWVGAGHPYIFGQVAYPRPDNAFGICIFNIPKRIIDHIQAMDGLFIVFRREVISSVKWDEQIFDGFHCYDVDCTFRAYLAGYKLAVVNDIPMIHASGGNFDAAFAHYAQLFMNKHSRQLEKMLPRKFTFASVEVPSRSTAIEVMCPAYWQD